MFSPEHLQNARFVYAASGDEAQDAKTVKAANAQGILVNAVDQPDICDFLTPSMVNRAPVLVAIGTEGTGPVLGQMIRKKDRPNVALKLRPCGTNGCRVS